MSRIIKFRAWDKLADKMYYSNKEVTVWAGGLEASINSDDGKMFGDFELMQFTGLLDKNGKDIFEGDILHETGGFEYYDEYGYVIFNDYTGSFARKSRTRSGEGDEQQLFSLHGNQHGNVTEIEIIGNIYEHPELLDKIYASKV